MNVRTIVEERPKNVAVMDVFSKLVQERIIFIDGPIDDDLANGVIAQMLYLDADNQKEISVYINSPGGWIYSGFAIFDVARLLRSPIKTVCIGLAGSMAAVLMLMGQTRCITQHSRILLHQPSGYAYGTADEIKINHEEIQKLKLEIFDVIEANSDLKNVAELCRLDTWFTAQEAFDCGLVTKIL
jgi:ATP-dependent Clp protease protease subunit